MNTFESTKHHDLRAGRTPLSVCAAAALLLSMLAATVTCASDAPDWLPNAKAGDIRVELSLLTKSGSITAKEPLIARVSIISLSKDPLCLDMGNSGGSPVHFEICGAAGEVLVSAPKPTPYGPHSIMRLAPGETKNQYWVVTGLYQFDRPGDYQVQVQFLQSGKDYPILAEATAPAKVLPYDARRLQERCEELFAPFKGKSAAGDMPDIGILCRALFNVNDDIVLPYLDWMAKQGERYAVRAIRRLDTPAAREMLDSLAERSGKVGETAQGFRSAPSDGKRNIMWEMGH